MQSQAISCDHLSSIRMYIVRVVLREAMRFLLIQQSSPGTSWEEKSTFL